MATTQRRGRSVGTKKTAPAKKPSIKLELTSGPTDAFDDREPFFTIDGREYTVLVEIPASVALEYLFTAAEEGDGAAIVFALNYALGHESRRALMTHRGLTQEQLGKIVNEVRAKFDGAVADLKALPSSD